ncbi:MAG: SPOR domain-containing protein [Candidatus Kaelpia aquatica]|nr:SPOR domain-containing protein [Candidatus Kaelpia aquatica]
MNKRFKIISVFFAAAVLVSLLSVFSFAEDFNDAWVYFLKERYNVSERIVDKYLKSGESSPEYLYLKSLLLTKRSSFEDARIYCDKLSRFGGKWSEYALLGQADTFFLSGKFDDADILYNTFMERFSRSEIISNAMYKYGLCLRKQGRWEDARGNFNLLVNRYPNSLSCSYARRILDDNEFYFTIQIGSFLNYDNAYNLSKKVALKNFNTYIKKIVHKGKLYYRVRVGRFDSRDQVESQFKKLVSLGYSGVIYP